MNALSNLMAELDPNNQGQEPTPRPDISELDGPDGLHLTSLGNAERFLRDYRADVLWVEGTTINSSGTFYCWDGQRWQPDNARAVLLAQQTVSNLKNLISRAVETGEKSDTIKALVNFWRGCETDNKIGEILSLARWKVVVDRGKFDADPYLLGVPASPRDSASHQLENTPKCSGPQPTWTPRITGRRPAQSTEKQLRLSFAVSAPPYF